MDISYVIWKEGKDYVIQALEVDVCTFGKSKKNAIEMLKDALQLYFKESKKPEMREIQTGKLLLHA